jgi:BirA family biotin operon repressor/biotin-[acetyl-CoA-carboxylase] ligase
VIHFQIEKLNEVASTNTVLLERARQGAPEGLVIVAAHQTAGRGKPGRQWLSPAAKNLLCSILLRPTLSPAHGPMLTQIACRAVAKVLKEKYAIASEFKRPNDVMAGTRKICGTLVEAISSHSKLEAAVIGIGLNINATDSELPPEGVSMKTLKGQDFSVDEVLTHILDEFLKKIHELYKTGTIK